MELPTLKIPMDVSVSTWMWTEMGMECLKITSAFARLQETIARYHPWIVTTITHMLGLVMWKPVTATIIHVTALLTPKAHKIAGITSKTTTTMDMETITSLASACAHPMMCTSQKQWATVMTPIQTLTHPCQSCVMAWMMTATESSMTGL